MQEDIAVADSSNCSGVLILMLLLAMGLLGIIDYLFVQQKKKLEGTSPALAASLHIGEGQNGEESNPVDADYVPRTLSSGRWNGDYTAAPIVTSWNEDDVIRKSIVKRFGGMDINAVISHVSAKCF
jgi:hypothetical protein